MLAEALKVVEAARSLDPYPGKVGIYRISCEPRLVPVRLRELREALEGFDKAVARGADAQAVLGRVIRYAARRGVDVRAMMAEVTLPEEAIEAEAEADLAPKPGEIGAPDTAQDITVSRQSAKDGDPVSGTAPEVAPKYTVDPDFPGSRPPRPPKAGETSRPMDPTQSPERAPEPARAPPAEEPKDQPQSDMPRMKLAERRLEQLAARVGWTPELQKIDVALRKAKDSMSQADTPDGTHHLMTGGAERVLDRVVEALGKEESRAEEADGPAPSFGGF